MGMEMGGPRGEAKVREAGAVAIVVEGVLRCGLFERRSRREWKASGVGWMGEMVIWKKLVRR